MFGAQEPFFDQLVRNLARGGSRREFVRQSAGFSAILGLSQAGLPARFARPLAAWFRIPAPCETHKDCGDPCLVCPPHKQGEKAVCAPKCPLVCTKCDGGNCVDQCTDPCLECGLWKAGHPASCIPKCQAGCSKCENGQCVGRGCTKPCEECFPMSRPDGSCQPVERLRGCIKCDPNTGKETNRCSACEKCVQGECVSDCPNQCELCDNGVCRKCDRPCEGCNEGGQCWSCDSECQRCNQQSGECETTCPGGMACCSGKCINCCGSCSQGGCDSGAITMCEDKAKKPTCCGPTCHDLDSDDRNCGSCGNACREFQIPETGERCEEGRCVCRGFFESSTMAVRGGGMECRQENHQCCDGNCVDVATYQTDPKHCGKCIVECEKDERCEKGQCVGSKRAGYSLVYVHRITSEKLGLETSLTMKAVVRRLLRPDAEGNTFAGKGNYEGSIHVHKVNCENDLPMDSETIPLVGKARGGATADSMGGGQTSLVFTITPLDPPKMHILTRSFRALEQLGGMKKEDMPDAVLPTVGNVVLKRGLGQESRTFQMWGGSCSGKLTHVMEWSATRIE